MGRRDLDQEAVLDSEFDDVEQRPAAAPSIFLTFPLICVLVLFVTFAPGMNEKHARILGELAEFGLALARKLHDQGMAAETAEETAELARAFHSVSRSVRQTLALEARLAREGARQAREDQVLAERIAAQDRAEAQRRARAPYENRKNRIGAVLERLVYSEYEDEGEIDRLMDEIVDRLSDDAQAEGFLEARIDDQIAQLCRDFGLSPPERPQERPQECSREPSPEQSPAGSAMSPQSAYVGDWAHPP